MPWLDPSRLHESEDDRALRDDLRQLMGLRPGPLLEARATPEMVALAERLREEAERRRHTLRPRSSWLLMAAAAFPFLLAAGALSAWGLGQKHRAEDLLRAMETQRNAPAKVAPVAPAAPAEVQAPTFQLARTERPAAPARRPRRPVGRELVLPVERSADPLPTIQTVKGHAGTVQPVEPPAEPAPQPQPR